MTSRDEHVVVLAGGTGGAKLARGMLDAVGPGRLTVIANTGDDVEMYGASVSPDPDLVCWWLADLISARGFGIEGDTFAVHDELTALGQDTWFALGDRDLAWCLRRQQLLDAGGTPTRALASLVARLGIAARVLPATDDPLRTWVRTPPGWRSFQEFMVRDRATGPIEDVEVRGAEHARPTAAVLEAIAGARAIVIGPSNPIISIGPMLAIPGMRDALRLSPAPVLAVSPIVGGAVLKGPTAAFMAHAGLPVSAAGVADCYAGLLDGIVADEPPPAGLATLQIDTTMDSQDARRRVAERVLDFALALAR